MKRTSSLSGSLVGYFAGKRWLLWSAGILAVTLAVMARTGWIHVQGNGRPTLYELSPILGAVVTWLFFKLVLKQDLIEEFFMGWIFGIQWEIMTEPYWTYLPGKFNILFWPGKDIPLLGLAGWGPAFTFAILLSEAIGKRLFGLNLRKIVFDWRTLVLDAVGIQVVGSLLEWFYGIKLHCWDYNINYGIGKSPLGLGWEIHFGYMIVMFWYGTTFRVWKMKLEGRI